MILSILKEVHTIKSHTDKVTSLLILHDGRLASCSADKTIILYCPISYAINHILYGHNGEITHMIQLKNGKLVSCSTDKSIKIWNVDDCYCDYSIDNADCNELTGLFELTDNRMATCSLGKNIIILNSVFPYNMITILKSFSCIVTSLYKLRNKEELLSFSQDPNECTQVWNLSSYQNECVIKKVCCYNINGVKEMNESRLIVGGFFKIYVVNTNEYKVEYTIVDIVFKQINTFLCANPNNILFGCGNGYIGIYNLLKKSIFIEQTSHVTNINCLVKSKMNAIISCSNDYLIKIWCM